MKTDTQDTAPKPGAPDDAQKSLTQTLSEAGLTALLASKQANDHPAEDTETTPSEEPKAPANAEPAKTEDTRGEEGGKGNDDGKRETGDEPLSDDVLEGMNPKTQRKVQKRIDKLTAEKLDLKQRIAELERQVSEGANAPVGIDELVHRADTERLEQLEANAKSVLDWYDDAVEEGAFVYNGQTLEADAAKRMRNTARDLLRKAIPERRKALEGEAQTAKEREAFDEKVAKYFPEYEDENSEDGQWMRTTYENAPALQKLGNGKFLVCLARIGMKAINAGIAAKAKAKPTNTKPDPKAPGDDGIAPAGAGAPAAKAPSPLAKRVADKQSLSENELAAFLSQHN